MFYYLKYVGLGFLKRVINVTKRTGLIHDDKFHMYHINKAISVSSIPTKENYDAISAFDVVIGFIEPNEYRNWEIEWINDTIIKYYNIPVPDYTPPQKEDYEKLFRILDKIHAENPKARILIHCYAGKGRSNCGVVAYLMYKHGMTADKAIELVEKKNPRSHMNRWQKDSLLHLEKYIPRV
jgi:protein-tyrosine phosphatase